MKLLIVLTALLLLALPLAAQEALAPDPVAGEAVYVPYPVAITLDGDGSDWAGVPSITVTTGTMRSTDPAENGSFTFSVAADDSNLYILATMPDKTIVTGQHGMDFWNEDSMEFYANFTGELFRTDYVDGVMQVNINPGNIGKTDPAALEFTGTNAASSGVTGIVFATEDGWGYEVAIPFPAGYEIEHGRAFGFQAHANGSSGADRDIKLIWSAADTADSSWQNPSVFGVGIFTSIGEESVPPVPERIVTDTAAEAAAAEAEAAAAALIPTIAVNQVGFLPDAPKFAMLATDRTVGTVWTLINEETGERVTANTTSRPSEDPASSLNVLTADFSEVTTPGTYRLQINDLVSEPFVIGEDVYDTLKIDAARYFYLNRSGIELDEIYAGETYARPAGHLSDSAVTCWSGTAAGQDFEGCDYTLDASKGWYDAGDYGKYVVNGGIATWTLLNLYERMPDAFPDGALNIPESGNGISDILDEARWEIEFLLGMQVPDGEPLAGMAHHKLHALQWDGLPVLPPTETDTRMLMPPSTAATYNLAAVGAMCARIYAEIDLALAARCLIAAEKAFDAGQANPEMLYGSIPGNGGGDYGDSTTSDEMFWAAAELYLTTGSERYIEAMDTTRYIDSFGGVGKDSAMYWGDTASLGALSLILHEAELPGSAFRNLTTSLVQTAETYLSRIESGGFRVSIQEYPWGSNSGALNNAIVLAYAYDLTGDQRYLGGVSETLDYILGRNSRSFSFVSGYGERAMTNPHHRVWANMPDRGFPPPPPGAIAGGPNEWPADPAADTDEIRAMGRSQRYIDHVDSYSTNEVAINWNAPLTWVAAYIAGA